MKMTDQEIKKYAKKLYNSFIKYTDEKDYISIKLMMELHANENPIEYLEKNIKKILTEPRLPRKDI